MSLVLGRSTSAEPAAIDREWLVTNGIGGFASGTVSDVLTRRYHGLLFAALTPPLGRTLVFTKADASVTYDGRAYDLAANRWADGTIAPRGFVHLDRFTLAGTVPTWSFAFSDVLLDRTIWMEPGANTTYVRFSVRRASSPVALRLKLLVNARDYHALAHAYDVGQPASIDGAAARVRLYAGAPELDVRADRGRFTAGDGWYYGFRLAAETERGLDDLEDHVHALTLDAVLDAGESLTLAASCGTAPADVPAAHRRRTDADDALLRTWRATPDAADDAPPWIEALVLAADQFVAARDTVSDAGRTIVAGYPWFGDWGRDTMIALPGVALATGRAGVARDVLATFARFVDRGMLPNRFPDTGTAPDYNTVDATLWFVEAIRRYVEATDDAAFLDDVFPALEQIVAWHYRGTRYGIRVDERDGLLASGEDGVQLTWMDAKVGDRVVTPRTGKAVEINALWHNALVAMQAFARRLGRPSAAYAKLAERAGASFERFWNPDTGYCFDVIDGPSGNDPSIRPNAVIAASFSEAPFDAARRVRIVHVAATELVTPYGLRSLSSSDPAYRGRYAGPPAERDGAYHQGTVWPWLLGPFVSAHLYAHGDPRAAAAYLDGIADLLVAYGVGTIAEIAEGDAPYRPRGCIAQAWSVGEILRAWAHIRDVSHHPVNGVPS